MSQHYRGHYRHSRTDESFHQFQERIRCIRQRSRDRFEQVRRISQQAQERLARLHESITSLRPARRLADGETDGPNTAEGGAGEFFAQKSIFPSIITIYFTSIMWSCKMLAVKGTGVRLSPLRVTKHQHVWERKYPLLKCDRWSLRARGRGSKLLMAKFC